MDTAYDGSVVTDDIEIGDLAISGLTLRWARRPAQRPSDRPPLLLLNGIGTNLEVMFPLMRALDAIETLTFDVPGVGGSRSTLLPQRLGTLANLATAFVNRVGHQQADVLGYSWGGFLAQQIARRHPDFCRRLILVSTTEGATMVPGKSSLILELASPLRLLSPRPLQRRAHALATTEAEQVALDKYVELFRPAPWTSYWSQLWSVAGWSSTRWLHELEQPTLILAGRNDSLVPLVNAHRLHANIANSTLQINDSGHLFIFALKEWTAQQIDDFLSAPVIA